MNAPRSHTVRIIRTTAMPPSVLLGAATPLDGTSYAVLLNGEGAAPEPGESVVMDFDEAELPLVKGTVESLEGDSFRVRVGQSHARDRREFPRVVAGLDLRYRVLPSDAGGEVVEDWLGQGRAPGEGEFRRADPFVDLSASGLSFDGSPCCKIGDRLLVGLAFAKGDTPWRGVARVVKVDRLTAGEIEQRDPAIAASHRISVELTDLTDEARQALLEHTVTLLRLPSESNDEGPSDEGPSDEGPSDEG